MLSITLIYALITILFVGSILNPILERCDVLAKHDNQSEPLAIEGNGEGHKENICSKFKKSLVNFD